MGGFHQVCVEQRLFKNVLIIKRMVYRHQNNTVALGSAAQAMEGHHFYRCMHL